MRQKPSQVMKSPILLAAAVLIGTAAASAPVAHHSKTHAKHPPRTEASAKKGDEKQAPREFFKPSEVRSTGTSPSAASRSPMTPSRARSSSTPRIGKTPMRVEAEAGPSPDKDKAGPKPEASMFYTAYFKQGAPAASRPITFLFNGGPGSSTVWLRMGAFGPVRVLTPTPAFAAAPYSTVDNDQSLLDASRHGVHRRAGHGLQPHRRQGQGKGLLRSRPGHRRLHQFITQFLTKYGRWNSPKYLFGESYGTMRGAGLALSLQNARRRFERRHPAVGYSQLGLHARRSATQPGHRPALRGRLPTYAATAWYLNKVPNRPADLRGVPRAGRAVRDDRLCAGAAQGERAAGRRAAADRAAAFGLYGPSVAYLLKTNLRIEYGAFQKELLGDKALTTGTLDTRFVGATLDPLSKVASTTRRARRSARPMSPRGTVTCRDRLHYDARHPVQVGHPDLFEVGLQASAARRRQAADHAAQRAARPRRRDEAEPRHEGDGQRRLFRRVDALFRRRDGDAAPAGPTERCGAISNIIITSPATWSTSTRRLWSSCTTMSPTSSGGRAGGAKTNPSLPRKRESR